jgi:hypothetical protein
VHELKTAEELIKMMYKLENRMHWWRMKTGASETVED